jgi:hypothetical protein
MCNKIHKVTARDFEFARSGEKTAVAVAHCRFFNTLTTEDTWIAKQNLSSKFCSMVAFSAAHGLMRKL